MASRKKPTCKVCRSYVSSKYDLTDCECCRRHACVMCMEYFPICKDCAKKRGLDKDEPEIGETSL